MDGQEGTVERLYDERMAAGGVTVSAYARSNSLEFYAESKAAWFGSAPAGARVRECRRFTAEWLQQNDPEMARLLGEQFPGAAPAGGVAPTHNTEAG